MIGYSLSTVQLSLKMGELDYPAPFLTPKALYSERYSLSDKYPNTFEE